MEVNNVSEVVCRVRYVKISPIKVRRIVNQIRRRSYEEAIIILNFMPHKACGIILKALRSAASNYTQIFNSKSSKLIIKEIRVDNAPFLKRLCPHAQGRAFPIKKHFSHIYVKLGFED
uniref:Large ribosomal subunit protein uL22c n=1 Tax=Lepocinclis ovum TaxID=86638 RepID=A0A3G3LM09_9EUGL|nr:ribosomal protein L22 [Lepocinclis ovum]AYQ93755.1 ribosomal protein L22 [Lepocinclis ovum]